VNRQEAARLTEHMFDNKEKILEDAGKLGVKIVVVTEGRKGATLISGKEKIYLAAKKVKTVEETGAGDGFGCGLVAGLIKGMSLREALKLGIANGASVATKFGPKEGLLFEPDVNKWMKK